MWWLWCVVFVSLKMSPNCEVCAEINVGDGHDDTPKHKYNRILNEFSKNRYKFSENSNGIVVSCSVAPTLVHSQPILSNFDKFDIKVSVKPRVEIRFKFTIKNNNNHEIVLGGVSLLPSCLNFKQQRYEELRLGYTTECIDPNSIFTKDVTVTFEEENVGVYKTPILFFFSDNETNAAVIISKEMRVFVEEVKKEHEKVNSPYAHKEVFAHVIIPTTADKRSAKDIHHIPADAKSLFEANLILNNEASDKQKDRVEKIKAIYQAGPTQENYIAFFHNLLWLEEACVEINLKNYNMSGIKLEERGQNCKSYALFVPGLAEKRPSLLVGDMLYVRPHNNDEILFEAIITEIHDNTAQFAGLNAKFIEYFKKNTLFDIRFFMSRMPLELMHVAVDSLRRVGQNHRVFPTRNAISPPVANITRYFNEQIEANVEQRLAVGHIVAGTSGTAPYLLCGPPGTGKTVTIVEAILQLVAQNPHVRILVCTDSNMAADHVATVLLRYEGRFDLKQILKRANSRFRVWETMPECLRPYSNGYRRSNHVRVTVAEFMSYNIVITTLTHAAKFARELGEKKHRGAISHVFIDEAAQACEPACLIPVCGLLATGGQLVLAGDPLQLGPVVISKTADKAGLGVSLMERLKKLPLYSDEVSDSNYMIMLRDNYRSHKDILSIPSEMFYNNQLRALAKPDPISSKDILGMRPASRGIIFHGVLSREQRMGKSPSFFNSMEMELVQKYIKALVDVHHQEPSDIGVITPYIRQVYKIKKWLRKEELDAIEVGTVEGYQGKEKKIIIISTVRATCDLLAHDAKFRLGFLADEKRFNVALTRAKSKVIVIGNPVCLNMDNKWRTYIERCREYGTYFGFEGARNEVAVNDVIGQIEPILREFAKVLTVG